jgi:hypothetical protein
MPEHEFEDGHLTYEIATEAMPAFDLSEWDDGYLAFSNAERRLSELKDLPVSRLLGGKAQGIDGVEGYLMEVGLWRSRDEVFEELSVEREDRGYFAQRWRLETRPTDGKTANCHFRRATTQPRAKGKLFSGSDLRSMEVVCPATRLHFFITCGGNEG